VFAHKNRKDSEVTLVTGHCGAGDLKQALFGLLMAVYYLDTSILLDYYERRGINGRHAFGLIRKIIAFGHIILFSDLHTQELRQLGYSMDEIYSLLRPFKPALRTVHIQKSQLSEASFIASRHRIPRRDALHAILARDNSAVLVATDRHFEQIRHICESRRPEEI